MALEICLVGLVVTSFWIGNLRTSRGGVREWLLTRFPRVSVAILSVGFATIIVIITTLRSGWARNQSNAVGMGVLSIALAIVSIESWFEGFTGIVGESVQHPRNGLGDITGMHYSNERERWSMMLAVNSHVLLISGLLISGLSMLIPIFLDNTVNNCVGDRYSSIEEINEGLGLVDLFCNFILNSFLWRVIFQPQILLIGLSVVALELGIVSWLGLRNEDSMVNG